MPYTDQEPDRRQLYPFINRLLIEMCGVKTEDDLQRLVPHVEALSDAITMVAERHGYFGAFAGQLNFALTTLRLRMLPKLKYVYGAHQTGWLEGIIYLFNSVRIGSIARAYDKRRSRLHTVRPDFLYAYITAWVFVRTCVGVAPDESAETKDLIVGVLRHADTEFYRRPMARYEDKKIAECGDLPEFVDLESQIDQK